MWYKMRRQLVYILFSFSIVFIGLEPVASQSAAKDELFKLSDDYRLIFTLIQKDAPVQIESMEVFVERTGGQPHLNFTLKNYSEKTVRRFELAFKIRTNVKELTGTGGGTGIGVGTNDARGVILPYGSYTEFKIQEYPMPAEVRNWFKPKSAAEDRKLVLIYAMVKKVVFSDGTVYENKNEAFGEF